MVRAPGLRRVRPDSRKPSPGRAGSEAARRGRPAKWLAVGTAGSMTTRHGVLPHVSKARASVGLPERWGIHGLRHYYATVLIHGGASVKTFQLALGHSTPTVTLNTYVHEWPDVLDRTRSPVDAALGHAKRRPRQAGAGHDRRLATWAASGPGDQMNEGFRWSEP